MRATGATRRGLLVAAGAATLLGGCGGARAPQRPAIDVRRVRYGPAAAQYADLRRPTTKASRRLTVVLLHGGYWLPQYAAGLMTPLAERFTELGCVTWNLEYRRTRAGGGWPTTFSDVAQGIDALAAQDVPRRTVLLGHSAGGHLAVWAASRTAATPGGPPRASPSLVVSLSGVLDLSAAARQSRSAGPVTALMGGTPEEHPDRYALGDPALLAPASAPVRAVQAKDEQVIDDTQAAAYVRAATAAGGTATAIEVPGDHSTLIDPGAKGFATVRRLVLDVG